MTEPVHALYRPATLHMQVYLVSATVAKEERSPAYDVRFPFASSFKIRQTVADR